MKSTGRVGLALFLKAALVLTAVAGASAAPFAYITNGFDGTVSVIDTALVGPGTNPIVAVVPVGSGTAGVAASPDGTRVYVTDANGTVWVISTATNAVVATVPVGSPSLGIAVTPDGNRVYVARNGINTVSVIDTTLVGTGTNPVIATITVGSNPIGVAVTPDGTRVYVANHNSNTVSVINTATNTVPVTLSVPPGGPSSVPYGVAVTPDGTRVYVTNAGNNSVSVIDTALVGTTNPFVAMVTVGSGPAGVAVAPDGTRVYVANSGGNTVSAIATATNTLVGAPVPVGGEPLGIAVTPDGAHVYVANFLSNTVSVIDTTLVGVPGSNPVVATVPVGTAPFALGKFIAGKPDPVLKVPHWFQAGIPAPPGCPGPACPAWWTPPYPGNFWAPDPYDDHSLAEAQQQGFTIGKYGCALTTLTTEANFWGNHLNAPMGFDTTFGLDPRQMNHWKGMYCTSKTCRGDVDWNNWAMFQHTNLVRVYRQCTPNAAATDKSCGKNTFPILPNNTAVPVNGLYTLDTATQTLDSILRNGDRGVPVILPIVDSSGVSVSNEKHWVVITGKASHVQTPSGSFIDTYLVNDPGDVKVEALDRFITTDSQGHVITHSGVADAMYATGDGISAASVRTSLLRIDQWKVYSIKPLVKMDPNTPQALGVYTSDPVEFVLTDPQGRRTGFDPGINTSFEEIPTSSYSHAVHRNEQDFSIPDPPPFKSLDMANQIDGQYTLNVTGTGSGDFTIEVRSSDAAGNWITQTYSGTTAPGVSSQFTFQGAVTTFAAFSANVAISPSHQAFGVDGSFTLGTGGTISPLTQPVTIQIGDTFLATIPAGSFEQTPQGTFVFGGVIQGVLLAAVLTPTGGNGYAFAIAGAGAPDLPNTNPVDLRLAIGSNGGSTSVNATFVP